MECILPKGKVNLYSAKVKSEESMRTNHLSHAGENNLLDKRNLVNFLNTDFSTFW